MCDCQRYEPTPRQVLRQKAFRLLAYTRKQLNVPIAGWIKLALSELDERFPKDDLAIDILYADIRTMTEHQRESIVYDAHSKVSRELADFWEDQQEARAEIERKLTESKRIEALKIAAMQKLSAEELQALGIK